MFEEEDFREMIVTYEIEVDIEIVDGESYYTAWTHLMPDVIEYGDNLYDVIELVYSSILTTEDYLGESLI